MSRYIDADALKERKFPNGESEYITGWNDAISAIMTFQPTVDAEPVKRGKWIKADSQQYFRKHYPCFTCSECGYRKDSQKKWNYCPHCGARMDEDDG